MGICFLSHTARYLSSAAICHGAGFVAKYRLDSAVTPHGWLIVIADGVELPAGEFGVEADALAIRTRQALLVDMTSWYIRHSIALAVVLNDLGSQLERLIEPETRPNDLCRLHVRDDFGHAPIILPAVLGIALRFSRAFYIHLALLHLSLALRVAGDLAEVGALRRWGGLLNAVALLVFLLIAAWAAISARKHTSARVLPIYRSLTRSRMSLLVAIALTLSLGLLPRLSGNESC